MDTKFQTSFIPKKNITQGVGRGRPESISIALLISIIIFILSLSAAGGVFFYKKVLIGRIATMDQNLTQAKNSFEPGFIEQLSSLNKRILSANKIISSHTVVSPILDLLGNDSLATIKFDTFTYTLNDDGSGSLSMAGQAKSFSSVALQSDIFGKEKQIKNPVFSDLNPDQTGNITFKFNAVIDPTLISYQKNMVPVQTTGN